MPYLMLDFKSEYTGQLSGEFEFTIIDTDNGKVIEIEGEAAKIDQTERPPTFTEMRTASQVLGHDPSQKIQQTQFDAIKDERNSYRQKALSADETIRRRNEEVKDLKRVNANLKDQVFDDDSRNLLASAIEIHVEELALTQNFEQYERAKKIFKKLTGKDWVNEDDS